MNSYIVGAEAKLEISYTRTYKGQSIYMEGY